MIFKSYTLNEVTEAIFSGGTPNTRVSEYWDGHQNWLSSGETSNDFIVKTEKTITQLGVDNSSTRLALKGDIVMASAGQGKTRGQTSLLLIDSFINQSVIALRVNKKKLNNKYLYYNLKSRYKELRAISDSASIRGSITTKMLKEFQILLPNLDSQDKVAELLYAFDQKIEVNNKIIANLEDQAQAIFKSWFIDFEPFQDGDFVESELGLIPAGWEVKTLGDLIELFDFKRVPLSKMARDKMEKVYPYYGANGIIDFVEDYLFDGKYLLIGEDGTVRTSEGHPILNLVRGKFWVSNHAHILKGSMVSTEFIYVSLKRRTITNIITGAVQEKINQKNLNSLKMIVADSKVQNKFEDFIRPIFKQIFVLEKQNQTLAQLRDTLLPKLMSGQIDLSNLTLNPEDHGHD